jgi:hypothetical protein
MNTDKDHGTADPPEAAGTSSYILRGGLLFWGARNIDGRGFDTEQNRPTNLQIPLIRK